MLIILIIAFLPGKMLFSKADEIVTSAEENALDASLRTEDIVQNNLSQNIIDNNSISNNFTNSIENEINNDTNSNNELQNQIKENIVSNTLENKITENTISNSVSENTTIENNISNNVTKDEALKFATFSSGTTNLLSEDATSSNTTQGETVVSNDTTSYSLQAVLYDTNQYSEGTGTVLTEEGAQVDGWKYDTSKYLQIDPNVPADGNTYIVTVELPEEFYIVATELIAPSGYQAVEFTQNEPLAVNNGGTYQVNTYSGTAKFVMNRMGISGTIQLEIRYDTNLWDKRANSNLTPDGVAPITVSLSKKDTEENITQLQKLLIGKATAGTKISFSSANYLAIDGNNNVSAVTVLKDKTVTATITYSPSSESGIKLFFNKVIMKVQCPYYTDADSNKHFLLPNVDEITFPNISNPSYQIESSQLESNGIFTITFDNYYSSTGTVIKFNLGPLSEELLALDANSFAFYNGKVTATVDSKNGTENISLFSQTMYQITYQKENLEKVTLSAGSKSATITERPTGAISELGGFWLENKGTGDSCEKTFYWTFDTENTNLIKVTTVNTHADTVQEYINIKYTLVDEDGIRVFLNDAGERVEETLEGAIGEWEYSIKNSYYNKTSTAGLRNTIRRGLLPESQRNYYFKTIEYTLNTIKAGHKLYAYQSNNEHTGPGNYFGYINENAQSGQSPSSTIKVVSSNPDIATLNGTAKTPLQTSSNPTYMLENVAMSKSTIEAGESVELSGRIEAVKYPYGNCTWIKGMTLGAILPKDVSINEQSIAFSTSKGVSITGFQVSTRDLGNGTILWIIKLPSDICVGYATESLAVLSTGSYVKFNMQLDTAYTIDSSTLFAKDILVTAGYKQTNAGSGTYSWSKKTDIYDLNENGSTTDNIACVRSNNTASCQIVAETATLDITNSISVDRQGSITEEGTEQSLLAETDIVNYNIDIGCFSGGNAEGFEYYIPIPKKTSTVDNFLISGDSTKFFDFEMIEKTTKTGDDFLSIQYSFAEGVSYVEAKELENWYTAEEIETNENLLWEKVTLIKITLNKERIENGDRSRISIKMQYSGEDYGVEAGAINVWHSGGYYKHINNDRETAGNFSTSLVTVDLKYSMELDEITLTAAPDMQPKIDGNVNTVTVEETVFPQFKNAHTFSITGVELYNATLQTKQYIEANVDMPGTDANKTFAITANMGSLEKDILSSSQTMPIEVGTLLENSAPEFTFKIYNANQLSDNSQIRYIIVTLTSDNGVTIKQKININREIKQATDPKSSIASGKRFVMFDEITEEVSISQDSAFTTQFVLSYIPDLYDGQCISFSNSLPVGTNIILAELTDFQNPNYWYYEVNSAISNIDLQNFTAMGTLQTKDYALLTGADTIEQKFLVIVDFSKCSSGYMNIGTYTVKMILESSNDSVDNFNSKELTFTTKGKRTFELTVPANANFGENFEISYSMQDTEGAESKYDGRKLSLIIKVPDNIASDTNLIIENESYYLNANKQFIIPLNDISNLTDTITIQMNSGMLPNAETPYVFEVELWVSATANANLPMAGELVGSGKITIKSEGRVNPALKITNMNKRVLHKNDLSENLETTFEYLSAADCAVTVELQQKVGTAYQKVTDRLNQVNNTTNHNIGVFDVNAIEGTNKVTMRLSSTTANSTYRLLFRVKNSEGELLTIPYNFIVAED
ncbi:MAG: hypothetical protein IKL55_01685 [Clostridia bacterium]|nr:hypothetical protein [Clostridia bacterium]